ncbi:MAG: aminoglycoside adenylyltransferase domain-containing protein [Chloroflexota bacterium]
MLPQLRQFPEVDVIVRTLLVQVQAILGPQFRGFYLHGSLALGDFDPVRSDIDFVVVTTGSLNGETVDDLADMHAQLAAGDSKWGRELEGSYIPQKALRRHNPQNATHPHIERGGVLRVEQHHSDWIIQRHVLRESGVTLAGPPPRTLIDPISPGALRQAVLDLLWWWELQLEDTSRVEQSGYQAYAILTMCRILYTMQEGAVATKPAAARWAQAHLEPRWTPLINHALRWQPDERRDYLAETLHFIRYTLGQARRAWPQSPRFSDEDPTR